jgi:phosphoglycerol transferase MdoB-like AlkP superfamily enzyme
MSLPSFKKNIYAALAFYLISVMALYSLSRIGFYFYNLGFFRGMNAHRFAVILWGGLRFDLTATLYCNSLLILLMIVPFKFRFTNGFKTTIKWIFLITNSLAFAANTADFIYYRFTLRRTTISVLNQFENEENLMMLFLRFLWDYWYAVIFWVAVVAVLYFVQRVNQYEGPKVTNKKFFYLGGTLSMVLIIYLFVGGVRGGFRYSTRPITLSNAAAYAEDPNDINLVLNTPFALLRTAKAHVIKKVNYFDSQRDLENKFNPIKVPNLKGGMNKKNVIILILESFSREFVGAYNRNAKEGTYKGYTPFLDSLINVSEAYQYSFANGRKSIDAMPSVISSIPSLEVSFVLSHYSGNKINGLPAILKKEGYYTAFFHGAPNGSMGFDAFARQSGFENYFGKNEYNKDDDFDGIWGVWDEPFLQFFAEKMNTFQQPFFTTLFTVSSHHPYKVPEKYENKFKGSINPMMKTVEYTDFALRKFFAKASKMGWFQNSIFVITADHASSEIELPEYNTAWGYFSIPIVFFDPSIDAGGIRDGIVQQIDIMPTVLGKLNFGKSYLAFGRDVNHERSRPFAVNYLNSFQFFMGDYLLQFDGTKSNALYNFKKDVFLENNLVHIELDSVKVFEERTKALVQQYKNRIVDNALTTDRGLN